MLARKKLGYCVMIVPTLCVGMHPVTLCVTLQKRNAERPWRHSHAGAWERSKTIDCAYVIRAGNALSSSFSITNPMNAETASGNCRRLG